MDLAAWAAALEGSALGVWMRTGGWSYAVANVAHVLGLVLLVGPILLLDLRLLGFGRQFDAQAVARVLVPCAAVGVVVMLCSGIALFSADARALAGNRLMQAKLVGVGLGLARVSALASIALWLSILVAGRMIAYV